MNTYSVVALKTMQSTAIMSDQKKNRQKYPLTVRVVTKISNIKKDSITKVRIMNEKSIESV